MSTSDPSHALPIDSPSNPSNPHADNAQGRLSSSAPASTSELSSLKISLRNSLRQFPDFPSSGILFEDILPIFANPVLHESLQRALELHVKEAYGEENKPDVIVGLDARGFLFGPTLALRLGAAFVPVRKRGKLPGPTETASFKKEYGEDFFQIQKDGIKAGQKVLIVDDIIATGRIAQFNHLETRLTTTQVDRLLLLSRSSKNWVEASLVSSSYSNWIFSKAATR